MSTCCPVFLHSVVSQGLPARSKECPRVKSIEVIVCFRSLIGCVRFLPPFEVFVWGLVCAASRFTPRAHSVCCNVMVTSSVGHNNRQPMSFAPTACFSRKRGDTAVLLCQRKRASPPPSFSCRFLKGSSPCLDFFWSGGRGLCRKLG